MSDECSGLWDGVCPPGASEVPMSAVCSTVTYKDVSVASGARVDGIDKDEVDIIRQKRITCQQENRVYIAT